MHPDGSKQGLLGLLRRQCMTQTKPRDPLSLIFHQTMYLKRRVLLVFIVGLEGLDLPHDVTTYKDWEKIDAEEVLAGSALGKPREKFLRVADMEKVIGR